MNGAREVTWCFSLITFFPLHQRRSRRSSISFRKQSAVSSSAAMTNNEADNKGNNTKLSKI